MWSIDTVKALYEQLKDEWEYGNDRELNIEYRECTGNFICFTELDFINKSVIYISDMVNYSDTPDDIIKMKFIYDFFVIRHSFEIERFIQFNNTFGMVEFLERVGKFICEKCGYTFYSLDDVHAVMDEKGEKYIEGVLKKQKNAALVKLLKNGEEYNIEGADSENIYLRSIKSDEIINLNDLKHSNGFLPKLIVTF